METIKVSRQRLQDGKGLDVSQLRTEWPFLISSSADEHVDKESLHCFQTTPDVDSLEFGILQQEDESEVTEFLLSHFFPFVPISKLVGMNVTQEVKPWLSDFVHSILASPTSIGIRKQMDGQLVAISVNAIELSNQDENSPDLADFVDPIQHPKMRMNIAFLEQLTTIPEYLAGSKALNLFMLAVHPEYSRRQLGSTLVRLSVQLAGRMGIKTLISQAVSFYAIRALEKCGFRSIKTLDYDQFVYDGDTPLANNGVHQHAALMILQL